MRTSSLPAYHGSTELGFGTRNHEWYSSPLLLRSPVGLHTAVVPARPRAPAGRTAASPALAAAGAPATVALSPLPSSSLTASTQTSCVSAYASSTGAVATTWPPLSVYA